MMGSAMREKALPELTPSERERYARHLALPSIGETGQRRLKAARVLVIGVGGLGSPISMYLAAAGVGHLGLVDDDAVSLSNLQRQVAHGTSTLGRPKVASGLERLLDLNPEVDVHPYHERFTAETAAGIASSYDLIVDGTDNFDTRYVINQTCVRLGIPYVYGAIFRLEGQVSVFGTPDGPCYVCVFPEPPPPETVLSGAEAGIMGAIPGTIGTLQATEAIKWIVGIGMPLVGRLLVYDAAGMAFESIEVTKNPVCPVCG